MTSFTARTILATAALSAAVSQAAAAQAGGQSRIDDRWRAYLGCWVSQGSNGSGGKIDAAAQGAAPAVCILPTEDPAVVDFVTVRADSVLGTLPLSTSGQKVPRTRDGCDGWERGQWSADDRRIYLTAEFRCGEAAPQTLSTMISLRDVNSFARIDAVKTRGSGAVRVIDFVAARDSMLLPAALRPRLGGVMNMATYAARVESAADVDLPSVADASRVLDPIVVESWLVDRAQRFELSAKDLRALKEAGVPARTIDMVVAVSYPQRFAVAVGGDPEQREPNPARQGRVAARDPFLGGIYGYDAFSPFGYGYGYGWRSAQLFPFYNNMYLGYGGLYSPYGYGYGYGYNYGLSGSGLWLPGNTPFVIVPGTPVTPVSPGNGSRSTGGRLTRDGYSQGSSNGGGRAAEPRSEPSRPQTSVGSGSGGGGGSSAGGGGGGGGEVRTAKPRP